MNQLLESAPSKAISNLNPTWFPTSEEPCKQFRSIWHHFPVFSTLQKVTELQISQTDTVSPYILQSSSLEDLTSFIRGHVWRVWLLGRQPNHLLETNTCTKLSWRTRITQITLKWMKGSNFKQITHNKNSWVCNNESCQHKIYGEPERL